MGNKLTTAGCFLGAMSGFLALRSAPTTDVQRVFRLCLALSAIVLIVVGITMSARKRPG